MKRVLMIAYHFPPLAGSSGIQRTLRFVQHLPSHGWQAVVLSAHPMAYERVNDDLLRDVPAGTPVRRALALDTARHLAVLGRHPGMLARPDRWQTWRWDAVRVGLRMVKEHRVDAIWSTYPIATAHMIGHRLQAATSLPWIADFRDPMAQDGYPADPATWRSFERIERQALEHAACAVFTTPGAARVYRERYPRHAGKVHLIENGYDEDSFAAVAASAVRTPGPTVLLHSGIVYPSERDPSALFKALAQLAQAGDITPSTLRVRFRAAVHDELVARLAGAAGVLDFVELAPPLPYRQALAEMLGADALLVLQAADCNDQIPAKLYEYLRAARPIIGLTDPAGDTAATLRATGNPAIAPLDDAGQVAGLLRQALPLIRAGTHPVAHADAVRRAARSERARDLAALLDRL